MSTLIARNDADAASIRQQADRVFDARSDLVHGRELTEEPPRDGAEQLLLSALKALLTDRPELIADAKARKDLGRR